MKPAEETIVEPAIERTARPERKSNGNSSPTGKQPAVSKKAEHLETALNMGHSVRLSTQLVKQAILKRVQETAQSRGIAVPDDILDFQNRAEIYFIDSDEKQVKIDGAILVWQE